jgi:hypothetical protein
MTQTRVLARRASLVRTPASERPRFSQRALAWRARLEIHPPRLAAAREDRMRIRETQIQKAERPISGVLLEAATDFPGHCVFLESTFKDQIKLTRNPSRQTACPPFKLGHCGFVLTTSSTMVVSHSHHGSAVYQFALVAKTKATTRSYGDSATTALAEAPVTGRVDSSAPSCLYRKSAKLNPKPAPRTQISLRPPSLALR